MASHSNEIGSHSNGRRSPQVSEARARIGKWMAEIDNCAISLKRDMCSLERKWYPHVPLPKRVVGEDKWLIISLPLSRSNKVQVSFKRVEIIRVVGEN